ncbi:hypothetical protein [Prosthecobacter sp.]|jgi:hypothetical protein|uniref:hypothetical protein n=1 Tax=Prosthecobacter sp. TaxID=1965333 RepID=UPI003783DA89
MKFSCQLFAASLLATLLSSCASTTMDSVPTAAELSAYERVIRARLQPEYDALEKQRSSGSINQETYADHKRRLDAKVSEEVNNAAWQKHFLAESERKADGIPTPDAPVALNARAGGGVNTFYQPSNQNFGNVMGQAGSAGFGSLSGAREQLNSQLNSVRNDSMSAGGTFLSAPPPGSVYDSQMKR